MNNARLLRRVSKVVSGVYCIVQLVNLLMIQERNSVVHISEGTSFSKYDEIAVIACCTPPLHLTTPHVMLIVWRLRGNIIRNIYISSVSTVNRNSSYSPVGP